MIFVALSVGVAFCYLRLNDLNRSNLYSSKINNLAFRLLFCSNLYM
jgi:hypothetical protein